MQARIGTRPLLTWLGRPAARAHVRGDAQHSSLRGTVEFFRAYPGTLVVSEFFGLPHEVATCAVNIFAMHIHESGDCMAAHSGTEAASLQTGGHYNPKDCPHPAHAGDLPPLFSTSGYAFQITYTDRFQPMEVIGRSVLVHARRDDFTSQPAGDAGARIGCGAIERAR